MSTKIERESLSSRLGFLLLSAGCAIGLGNIWRFPYIAGKYGGGYFVLLYLIFLFILGLPVMIMELSVGRSSKSNLVDGYGILARGKKNFWKGGGYIFFGGNLVLMMFYTTVAGWLLAYSFFEFNGSLQLAGSAEIGNFLNNFIVDWTSAVFWVLVVTISCTSVCACGLRSGVERVVKWMMLGLFLMMLLLCVNSLFLDGLGEGMKFYLLPSWDNMSNYSMFEVIMAAMGQAFFTLGLGVGSMSIFGSYTTKEHSLVKESINIIAIDTAVALLAGMIIFPVCFSFNVDVTSGPALIFISLPNVFNQLVGGRWWGGIFFIFMSLAALTTVIAICENLIAFVIEKFNLRRIWAALIVGCVIFVTSLPCALGFGVLSFIRPFGGNSTILDLEDFILSDNLLPLGSLFLIIFCVSKYGWGSDNAIAEANCGKGLKMPYIMKHYIKWVLPAVMLFIFAANYYVKFIRK